MKARVTWCAELPGVDELDQKELRFLEDFCNLLVTAHYRLLTEEEWETATDEEFTVSLSQSSGICLHCLCHVLLLCLHYKQPARKMY